MSKKTSKTNWAEVKKLPVANLVQQIEQITKLQRVDTPFKVVRVFGKVQIYGDQLYIASNDNNDYVSVPEFKQAIAELAEMLGGTVSWGKK